MSQQKNKTCEECARFKIPRSSYSKYDHSVKVIMDDLSKRVFGTGKVHVVLVRKDR